MKPGSADKKQTLKLKIDNSIRFRLLGISSHENDYRLVWSVNNQLDMAFLRTENLLLHNQKLNLDMEFSRFVYNDEERYLKFFLFSNRCPDGFLFPEIKNLDYLLQIAGDLSNDEIARLMKGLKTIPVISAVFTLQPEKIKGVDKIVED